MSGNKFIGAAMFVTVSACHHAPPAVASSPEQASAPARTEELARSTPPRPAEPAVDRGAADRELAAARAAMLRPLYFDFDSASVRGDQNETLEAKVPVLTNNQDVRIRIEGNADERGSAEYNIALGMRRAAEAKRFLSARGVDAGRIDIVSYGEERAVCTTHEESCWQQNRRDDFRIIAGELRAHSPKS